MFLFALLALLIAPPTPSPPDSSQAGPLEAKHFKTPLFRMDLNSNSMSDLAFGNRAGGVFFIHSIYISSGPCTLHLRYDDRKSDQQHAPYHNIPLRAKKTTIIDRWGSNDPYLEMYATIYDGRITARGSEDFCQGIATGWFFPEKPPTWVRSKP